MSTSYKISNWGPGTVLEHRDIGHEGVLALEKLVLQKLIDNKLLPEGTATVNVSVDVSITTQKELAVPTMMLKVNGLGGEEGHA